MNEVNAAIVTIGDELLIGQTIDTNSAFIAQELNKIGVWLKRRVAVGDIKEEIIKALNEESASANLVIITGGLGPTADDITKPTLCEYFGSQLVVDGGALQNVRDIFLRSNRPIIEKNLKQAEVPNNCIVLQNKRGTAPGMWFEKDGVIYASLPGVPHEMRGLITEEVIPRIKENFTLPAVIHRTLLTAGIGESMLADAIKDFEESLPSYIKLAYLPAFGMVRLRLTGRGQNAAEVEKEVEQQFSVLKQHVEEWMVVDRDISIQEAILDILRSKGKTLGTAESCTGGYIAHLLTSIAGSSDVYLGSVISYANEVKENILSISPDVLQSYGAVSQQTVEQMVKSALEKIGSDYVIATSGIMGPTGGTEEKPVGTVWIAVGNKNRIQANKLHFRFDRMRNIQLTVHTALNMLRKFVQEQE